jgi:hypothetical protein
LAYEVVENFAAGLDNRKSPLTAPGGTLTRLTNAAINPGGEIEKRRAFVRVGTNTLAGTFGLAATSSTLYAFTRDTDVTPPATGITGTNLVFQKLPNSDATKVAAPAMAISSAPTSPKSTRCTASISSSRRSTTRCCGIRAPATASSTCRYRMPIRSG